MSFLHSSWDLQLEDKDDQKYFRFVGEEWVWFKLNADQQKWIEAAGKRRSSFGKSKTKSNYSKGDSSPLDISGMAAELVSHYFTGEPLNQIELKSKTIADLGRDIEIKSTRYAKNWTMYVNESQLIDSRRYIFAMTFLYPKYVALLGWCYGRQFPRELHAFPWREKERAYRISHHALSPMSTFERNGNV